MKTFKKKPDTVEAIKYSNRTKKEITETFETIEKGGVIFIVTPNGHLELQLNNYVIVDNGEIKIENKAQFEAKFEEVKTK